MTDTDEQIDRMCYILPVIWVLWFLGKQQLSRKMSIKLDLMIDCVTHTLHNISRDTSQKIEHYKIRQEGQEDKSRLEAPSI